MKTYFREIKRFRTEYKMTIRRSRESETSASNLVDVAPGKSDGAISNCRVYVRRVKMTGIMIHNDAAPAFHPYPSPRKSYIN